MGTPAEPQAAPETMLVEVTVAVAAPGAPAPTEAPAAVAPSDTPAITPTATPTVTATITPTATPTLTAVITGTATPTITAIITAVGTSSATPSPTATATQAPPTETPIPGLPTDTPTHVPAPPTPTPTPIQIVITDWKGEYFDNISLDGSPVLIRNDPAIDFNLPATVPPATNMPSENWSALWSRTWTFAPGTYRFHLVLDDGARLWVNNDLLINQWEDGSTREFSANLTLDGSVPIVLEYYNHVGTATIRLSWEPVTEYADWKGSYFANPDLAGLPVFEQDDAAIEFDWGTGSPRLDIPDDNFSVRWTRDLSFEAGPYQFQATSDDGVRVYVDDSLVIDEWRDNSATYQGDIQLTEGRHTVRVEYYERTVQAFIKLSWVKLPLPAASPTAITTAGPTAAQTTALSTATPTPIALPGTPTRAEPAISLRPASGPIGRPFDVIGQAWPANETITLYLGTTEQEAGELAPVGQVVADDAGNFTSQVTVPAGQGWEGRGRALIMAIDRSTNKVATGEYALEPALPTQPMDATASPTATAEPLNTPSTGETQPGDSALPWLVGGGAVVVLGGLGIWLLRRRA